MQRIIIAILGLILATSAIAQPKEITLEDVFYKGTFRTDRVPGFSFLKDGRHYTQLRDNQVQRYDLTTGDMVEVILDGSSINEDYKLQAYTFSGDEGQMILRANTDKIYRRSFVAEYMVYNRSSQQATPIFNLKKVSYVTLNPQGNKVAFVYQNDLYIQDLTSMEVLRVTNDGEKNKIINGHTDWVYEEEFSFVKAFEWSPEGNYLAFLRFDEREVREFTMTLHHDEQYPHYETFKYPKVGEKNAIVTAHIYGLGSGETKKVDIKDEYEYIPRIKWSSSEKGLCVYTMNRHQSHLKILLVNPEDGSIGTMLEEKNKYYIDIHDNLTFVDNGKCFLWTSEKDGNNHIYLYTIKGEEKRQITQGNWEVTSFYGYDEKEDEIYFQSTEPGSTERGLYRIDLKGKKKEIVSDDKGYNSAQFSSTFDYYVLQHSRHDQPPTFVVRDRDHKVVRPLVDNAKAKAQLEEYDALPVELMEIPTTSGHLLNAALILPRDFDEDKEYPLFMYLYGGPGSQQVMDRWNSFRYFWWFQYLANQGVIIAVVDNRGTGGKGEEFKKMTYLQLGKYETEDQIEAAKWLSKRKYIDKTKVGIFGWSYGGYMSTLCVLKGNDVFSSAIAVAPVTSWKWYDTIYTERYMRTVEENPDGYKDNSPVYFADRLKGNYLLVHGMADDNVHFQNAAEMAKALIKENKQFDTYYYPNKNHGIYGGKTRLHLFTKMTDFVLNKI